MSFLSNRVNNLGESKTLAMARMTNELKQQGKDVVNLTLGEPDFAPFEFFKESAKRAIDENTCRYSPVPGYPELKEAVVTKLKRDNGLDYETNQVVTSTGAKQSIANLMLALINQGDEVILPAPYWVTYYELVKFAKGEPRVVFAGSDQNFKITPEQLEAAISDKTKAFLFSNPCNPTGAVYSQLELAALADVFKKYPQVLIISDEIYEHICYGEKLASLASFEAIKERVIIVNGLSKAFAATGWRLGYIAAPADIAKACQKIQSQFTSGANVIAQKAAIDALNADPIEMMKERADIFEQRRNFICEGLSAIDGIELPKPDGAFYVFPNVSKLFGKSYKNIAINSSQDFSMALLENLFVGTTPGEAFGAPGYIRLSYAASSQELETAVERITSFVAELV